MVDKKCDGKSQSPIDITKSVSLNENLKKIELSSSWDTSSLQTSTKFKLENKGYTVQLTIDSNVQITSTQSGKTFHEQSLTAQHKKFSIKDLLMPVDSLCGKFHSLQRCIQNSVICYLRWSCL